MGKIVASYLIKVTLREKDAPAPGEGVPEPPTIAEIEGAIGQLLYDQLAYFTTTEIGVSAERTDV